MLLIPFVVLAVVILVIAGLVIRSAAKDVDNDY